MLETRIEELTAAITLLTAALAVHGIATAPEVVKEPKAKKPLVEGGQSAGVVSEVPNEKQQNTTDTSPSSEPESAPVTYDDVKKATNALSAAKGRDVTIDTLSRFGVKRATELDEGQWADYIAYTEKVIADE
jgi:hypothetical protein